MQILQTRRTFAFSPAKTGVALAGGLNTITLADAIVVIGAQDWISGARARIKLVGLQVSTAAPTAVSIESAFMSVLVNNGNLPAKPLQFGALTALINQMAFESSEYAIDFDGLQLAGLSQPVAVANQGVEVKAEATVDNSGGATTFSSGPGLWLVEYDRWGTLQG